MISSFTEFFMQYPNIEQNWLNWFNQHLRSKKKKNFTEKTAEKCTKTKKNPLKHKKSKKFVFNFDCLRMQKKNCVSFH